MLIFLYGRSMVFYMNEINYKKSVLSYLQSISTNENPMFKLLSMLEILSDSLTKNQWKQLYNIACWRE